jgi:hypothetical protein
MYVLFLESKAALLQHARQTWVCIVAFACGFWLTFYLVIRTAQNSDST